MSFYRSVKIAKKRPASAFGPSTLFLPCISTSRSSLYECDYNLHKSNSSYFSNFDIARLNLIVQAVGKGIDITRNELLKENPKDKSWFNIPLGGVAINFRREIKPLEKFEIWTRVLAWDRKWLYIVGHFVKPGTCKPKRYLLQPWKNVRVVERASGEEKNEPVIYACAIAKYCFKKNRLTIPPERVLRAASVLPPKPAGIDSISANTTPNGRGGDTDAVSSIPAVEKAAEVLSSSNAGDVLLSALEPKVVADDEWYWQHVEDERLRGLKIAEMYNGLDQLQDEFRSEEGTVLSTL